MLAIRALRKCYADIPALDGVDLDAVAGEIVGLLGVNGAGKTTLVSIVAGLRTADSGSVRVGDVDALAHPHQARHLLGIAPQETGVYTTETVRENITFFARLAGIKGNELTQRVDEAVVALDLTGLLDRETQTLSGGEQRRVHTAMAIVKRPPLVLLDEPTVGADVHTRAQLLESVRNLAREGAAVVYSTHYLPEITTLDARVTIIDHGRVIATGTPADLVRAHADTAIEMTFDGAPPELQLGVGIIVERDDQRLRILTTDPAATTRIALEALADHTGRLRSLEIVEPSLDAVFLALTGHRISHEVDGDA